MQVSTLNRATRVALGISALTFLLAALLSVSAVRTILPLGLAKAIGGAVLWSPVSLSVVFIALHQQPGAKSAVPLGHGVRRLPDAWVFVLMLSAFTLAFWRSLEAFAPTPFGWSWHAGLAVEGMTIAFAIVRLFQMRGQWGSRMQPAPHSVRSG